MTKVLFFIKNISLPAGTERMTAAIASELSRKGYEVAILSMCGDGSSFFDLDSRVKTYVLFRRGKEDINHYLNLPIIFWKYFWFLKKLRPQVVIDLCRPMSVFSIPLRSFFNYKVITWEHFNYSVSFSFWSKCAQKIVMKYTDMLVCLTKEDEECYTKEMPATRVTYIHNSITVHSDEVSPMTEKILLNIGRVSFQKGQDLLLEAWSRVENKNGWKLRMLASGKREDISKFKKHIQDLKLEDSVEMLPSQKDIVNIYRKAAVFVLSSRFEGLVLVLIEALFMGLPVVTFDITPTIRDLITSHNVGILCKPEDTAQLAQAIQAMINDDSLRMEKAKNARAAVESFQLDRISKQWQQLLEDLV